MLSPDQFAVHVTCVTVSLRGNWWRMPSEQDALMGGGDWVAFQTRDASLVNHAEQLAGIPSEEHVAVMSSADADDAAISQKAAITTITADHRLMSTTHR